MRRFSLCSNKGVSAVCRPTYAGLPTVTLMVFIYACLMLPLIMTINFSYGRNDGLEMQFDAKTIPQTQEPWPATDASGSDAIVDVAAATTLSLLTYWVERSAGSARRSTEDVTSTVSRGVSVRNAQRNSLANNSTLTAGSRAGFPGLVMDHFFIFLGVLLILVAIAAGICIYIRCFHDREDPPVSPVNPPMRATTRRASSAPSCWKSLSGGGEG